MLSDRYVMGVCVSVVGAVPATIEGGWRTDQSTRRTFGRREGIVEETQDRKR